MNLRQLHQQLNQAIHQSVLNKNVAGTRSGAPTAVFHRELAHLIEAVLRNKLKPTGLMIQLVTEFGIFGSYGERAANIDIVLFIKEINPSQDNQWFINTGKLSASLKTEIEQRVQGSHLTVMVEFKHFVSSFGKNVFNHAANSSGEALRILSDHQGVYGKRKGLWFNLLASEGEMSEGGNLYLETREPLDTSMTIESLFYKTGIDHSIENMRPLSELIKTQWLVYDLHPKLVATLKKGCSPKKYQTTMNRLAKEGQFVAEVDIKQFKEVIRKIEGFIPSEYMISGVINRSVEEIDDSLVLIFPNSL